MTAHDDQLDAAISHVQSVAQKVGDYLGRPDQKGEPIAGPIKTLVDTWRERADQGKLRIRCKHVGRSPQPVVGYLAMVGEVCCLKPECADALRAWYFQKIPHDRCDACGQRPADNVFREITIHGGVAFISGNVCRSCFNLANPDAKEAPDAAVRERAVEIEMNLQGSCPYCSAVPEKNPHPLSKRLTVVNVRHDSWCPALKSKGTPGRPSV